MNPTQRRNKIKAEIYFGIVGPPSSAFPKNEETLRILQQQNEKDEKIKALLQQIEELQKTAENERRETAAKVKTVLDKAHQGYTAAPPPFLDDVN